MWADENSKKKVYPCTKMWYRKKSEQIRTMVLTTIITVLLSLLVSLSLGPSMEINILLADFWLVCLHSWVVNWLRASGAGSELSSWLRKKSQFFCIVFCDSILSCKILLLPPAKERQENSNAVGNWHRQWATTDLIQCHRPCPGRALSTLEPYCTHWVN